MAGNQQQGTAEQGTIRTIRLPAAETRPPELDGNFRSWGHSGGSPQPAKDKSAELEAGS